MTNQESVYFNSNKEYSFLKVSINDKTGWEEALSNINVSVYFDWEYLSAISDNYPSPINLLKIYNDSGGVVLFYTTRSKDSKVFDIYSPYALDGIYYWGVNTEKAFTFLINYFKENKVATYYLLVHPGFIKDSNISFSGYRTIYALDLNQNIDEVWRKMHNNHRYEINKFLKCEHDFIEDKKTLIHTFIRLYQNTIDRVNASNTYNFSESTLQKLVNAESTFVLGASIAGKIECVVIFLVKKDWAEYFINASTIEGRFATRALIWEVINRLKPLGVRSVNLGGGIQENDHLDQFKRRFGGKAVSMGLYKGIALKTDYDRLCQENNVTSESTSYFPPYWAPAK